MAVAITTTQEVALTIIPIMLSSITTTVMRVMPGTATTASGMGITITTAGTGTASESWRELLLSVG